MDSGSRSSIATHSISNDEEESLVKILTSTKDKSRKGSTAKTSLVCIQRGNSEELNIVENEVEVISEISVKTLENVRADCEHNDSTSKGLEILELDINSDNLQEGIVKIDDSNCSWSAFLADACSNDNSQEVNSDQNSKSEDCNYGSNIIEDSGEVTENFSGFSCGTTDESKEILGFEYLNPTDVININVGFAEDKTQDCNTSAVSVKNRNNSGDSGVKKEIIQNKKFFIKVWDYFSKIGSDRVKCVLCCRIIPLQSIVQHLVLTHPKFIELHASPSKQVAEETFNRESFNNKKNIRDMEDPLTSGKMSSVSQPGKRCAAIKRVYRKSNVSVAEEENFWKWYTRLNSTRVRCKNCPLIFAFTSVCDQILINHIKFKHEDAFNETSSNENVKETRQLSEHKEVELKSSKECPKVPGNLSMIRRTMRTWTYFTKVGPGEASCNICGKLLTYEGRGNINLVNHLEICLPDEESLKFRDSRNELPKIKREYYQLKEEKTRSKAWNHFTKIGPTQAKCLLCMSVLSFGSGNTSNLTRHLHKIHSVLSSESLDDSEELVKEESTCRETKLVDANKNLLKRFVDIEDILWFYFTVSNDQKETKCNICRKVLSNDNDRSLMSHLHTYHGVSTNEKGCFMVAKPSSSGTCYLIYSEEHDFWPMACRRKSSKTFSYFKTVDTNVVECIQCNKKLYCNNLKLFCLSNHLWSKHLDKFIESSFVLKPMKKYTHGKADLINHIWESFDFVDTKQAVCSFCSKGITCNVNLDILKDHLDSCVQVSQSLKNVTNSPEDNESMYIPNVMNRLKGRLRSWVWTYFNKKEESAGECRICSRILSIKAGNVSNLTRHLERNHSFTIYPSNSKRIRKIQKLPKNLISKSLDLLQHYQKIPNSIFYNCKHCRKVFSERKQLKMKLHFELKHDLRHSEDKKPKHNKVLKKKYKCSFCKKRFNWGSETKRLINHLRENHFSLVHDLHTLDRNTILKYFKKLVPTKKCQFCHKFISCKIRCEHYITNSFLIKERVKLENFENMTNFNVLTRKREVIRNFSEPVVNRSSLKTSDVENSVDETKSVVKENENVEKKEEKNVIILSYLDKPKYYSIPSNSEYILPDNASNMIGEQITENDLLAVLNSEELQSQDKNKSVIVVGASNSQERSIDLENETQVCNDKDECFLNKSKFSRTVVKYGSLPEENQTTCKACYSIIDLGRSPLRNIVNHLLSCLPTFVNRNVTEAIRKPALETSEKHVDTVVVKKFRTQKKSPLWKHFKDLGQEKGECYICKVVISYKGGALNNLSRHLRSKHSIIPTQSSESNVIVLRPTSKHDAQKAIESGKRDSTLLRCNKGSDNSLRRSKTWQFFTKTPLDWAQCNICKRFFSFKGGTINNLTRHLRTIHPKYYEMLLQQKQGVTLKEEVKFDNTAKVNCDQLLEMSTKCSDALNTKKKSHVWTYFTMLDASFAMCNFCEKRISYKGGGTSNLARHLRIKHGIWIVSSYNFPSTLSAPEEEVQGIVVNQPASKNVRSCQLKSRTWDYFEKLNQEKVRCKLCSKHLSFKSKAVHNLTRHLQLKHQFLAEEAEEQGYSMKVTTLNEDGEPSQTDIVVENANNTCMVFLNNDYEVSTTLGFRPRPKTSFVWNYFKDLGKGSAECSLCCKQLSYKGGATNNLTRHLKVKHSFVIVNDPSYIVSDDGSIKIDELTSTIDASSQEIQVLQIPDI